MRTAGITSSLFCVPTYRIIGVATPCPESGNCPGVSALKNLTARSVVILLSNLKSYGNKELSIPRERNAEGILLPPAGQQQIPQDDDTHGGGTHRLDHRLLRTPRRPHPRRAGFRGGEDQGSRRCAQPAARRQRSVPGVHLRTLAPHGERLHPDRAHQRSSSVAPAADYRLQGVCGTQVRKEVES